MFFPPKSFTTLINTSYSMKNYTQTSENNQDAGILSNPLSFIRNGFLDWSTSSLGFRSEFGNYWSLRSASTISSSYLRFLSTFLNPQNETTRGIGFAVRCLTLAPDSICPKGWQLPTYSGDKSFTTLINTSYSMKNCTSNCESNQDSGVLSNPLSFLRDGYFLWYDAGTSSRGTEGSSWSLRSSSTTSSNRLDLHNTGLNPQGGDSRGIGFAVRCVPNPSPLSLILAIL